MIDISDVYDDPNRRFDIEKGISTLKQELNDKSNETSDPSNQDNPDWNTPEFTINALSKIVNTLVEQNADLRQALINRDPWEGKGGGIYYFQSTGNPADREIVQIMTLSEYEAVLKELKMEKPFGFPYWDRESSFYRSIMTALSKVDEHKIQVINQLDSFQEDVRVLLRAIALQVETFCNAGTHREKNVLASGIIRLIETALQRVADSRNKLEDYWWERPDVFRADYPVRRYQQRIKELEEKLKGFES